MKIDQDILDIIDNGCTENNIYFLPKVQLDRKTYLKVNKVLEALGGKWNRKAKGHIFDKPIEDVIENVILTEEVVDKKKELQFFETPENIADSLCKMAKVVIAEKILEPEAGKGSIVRSINKNNPNAEIVWCEIDDENASHINIGKRIGKNFLELEPNIKIDCVIMNPPFSKQQDIDHVTHALKFLKEGGILVSVMSPSIKFRTNKKTMEFKNLLCNYEYSIVDLPDRSFKKSGTTINTIVLTVVN